MGGINVASSLGEPLKAEIELVAAGKAEKGRLVARLASPEAFKGAGIDYPSGLPKLKFQIETRANGESYLSLTSAQPVNEPFVSVLIELVWSSGKLLREYTFLLDPPEFRARQPEAAEVKPVLSKTAEPVEAAAPPAPTRAVAPPDEKDVAVAPAPARKAVEVAPAAKTAESGNVATGAITVKRGDTLSQIAVETKPAGVSLERMLLALYRANSDAFDGNNMNRLKAGKILRMPEQGNLNQLTQAEAVKEFRAQVADWNAYRQKLAAASGAAAEQPSRQEASGKIGTAIADKSSAAQEPAKEVVRLSKGEAPGDKAVVSGNAKAMQEKIHTLEEEAIARSKALKESNERVAMLEKNIKEMQRLIELKSQPAAAPAKPAQVKAAPPETRPEPPKVDAKPAAPAPVAASQPPAPAVAAAASAAAPASAAKPAKPAAPKVAPPPPSLLDNPLYLAAGAAALLALGGLGLVLARRGKGGKAEKKKTPEDSGKTPVDVGSTTGRIIAPPASSPETGDFTQAASATLAGTALADEVDPISEAELFLNFGRDAQAEEILKDALAKNPASNPIRLKLLPIYANRKDTNSFSVIARQIEASGDAAAWAQAAEMGRSLEPGNPMYGGTGGEPAVVSADQAKTEQQPAAGLDFDLGFGADETAAATASESSAASEQPSAPPSTGLDFDLGAGETGTAEASDYTSTLVLNQSADKQAASGVAASNLPEDARAAQEEVDFDISGISTPVAEPEKSNLDDLVFDITASQPSLAAMPEDKSAATDSGSSDDKTIAFTLDFPAEAAPAQPAAKEEVDFDLGSISLELEAPATAPAGQAQATQVRDAHWHDIATKLDLAKAYQEMGDNAGAREILDEVMAEGDEQQRATAEAIKQQLLA